MKLVIATPLRIVGDIDDVVSLRAEDDDGSFGIRPGHADFMTALRISVIGWQTADGKEGNCAVRGGILLVSKGETVSVASAEAIMGGDLSRLEPAVIQEVTEAAAAERRASAQAERLRVEAIRRIVGLLRPDAGEPRMPDL